METTDFVKMINQEKIEEDNYRCLGHLVKNLCEDCQDCWPDENNLNCPFYQPLKINKYFTEQWQG